MLTYWVTDESYASSGSFCLSIGFLSILLSVVGLDPLILAQWEARIIVPEPEEPWRHH